MKYSELDDILDNLPKAGVVNAVDPPKQSMTYLLLFHKSSIACDVSWKDNACYADNNDLNLHASGKTQDEAIQEAMKDAEAMYQHYTGIPRERTTGQATYIWDYYNKIKLMESVPDSASCPANFFRDAPPQEVYPAPLESEGDYKYTELNITYYPCPNHPSAPIEFRHEHITDGQIMSSYYCSQCGKKLSGKISIMHPIKLKHDYGQAEIVISKDDINSKPIDQLAAEQGVTPMTQEKLNELIGSIPDMPDCKPVFTSNNDVLCYIAGLEAAAKMCGELADYFENERKQTLVAMGCDNCRVKIKQEIERMK